jgi:hypothetical protein
MKIMKKIRTSVWSITVFDGWVTYENNEKMY